MVPETETRRAKIFGKVAAIFIGALGLFVIGAIFFTLPEVFRSDISPLHQIILMGVPAGMISIGWFCLLIAYRAWSCISAHVTRQICLIAAVLSSLGLLALAKTPDRYTWPLMVLVLLVALGGLLYLAYSRLLIKWLALPDEVGSGQRQKAAKVFFSILACLVWLSSSSIILDLAPKQHGYTHGPEHSWWFWSALLGSLVPAYLVYQLGMHIARRYTHVDSKTDLQ